MWFNLQLQNNNVGKIAFNAGLWYVISNIIVKTITIITTPLFTRLISTEEYGTVQTFISWETLFLPIFTLNLTYSIGRAKLDYPDKLDSYIGSMQLLSAVVSSGLVLLAILFIVPISRMLELSTFETLLLAIYLFFIPAIQMYQNGYKFRYQYKQNIFIAWYTAITTTTLAIALILTSSANKADMRIIGLVVPTVILSLFYWIKSIKDKLLQYNKEFWIYGLKLSLPLVAHIISLQILSQSDRIIITKMCGKSYTGIYSLAYTYGVLLCVFTTAISEAWLPWFHDSYYDKNFIAIKKNVNPLVILGCYICLACIAFAPEAIHILGGTEYYESIPCVAPVALGVICQYIYTHYVNIEMHLKKTIYVPFATAFVALLNIFLNLFFIPKYGFVAAAYTTLISYIVLMIIHFFITKRILRVSLYSDAFMFGALIVTGIVALIIVKTYNYTLVRYILISLGFFSCLFYYKDYIKNWYINIKK